MTGYRVEKRAVDSVLLFHDGTRLEGYLYLAPCSPSRSGAQTVADLMEETAQVLPFRHRDGRFALVGRGAVAAVRVRASEIPSTPFLDRIPARVRLTGGHTLEGSLLIETGAGSRLSDLLNTTDPWCRLEEPGAVYWVSKFHLLEVEPRG